MKRRYQPPRCAAADELPWASPLRLPPEVIAHIGRHSDAPTFFALGRTCGYFRRVLLGNGALLAEQRRRWGFECEPTVERMCRETGRRRIDAHARSVLGDDLWQMVRRAERRWGQ